MEIQRDDTNATGKLSGGVLPSPYDTLELPPERDWREDYELVYGKKENYDPEKKPAYHQSGIKSIFDCPKRFKLSMSHHPYFTANTQKTLNQGKIIENVVFDRMVTDEEKKLLHKGRTPATIKRLEQIGAKVKERGYFGEGTPHLRFQIDLGRYFYRGEYDFLGECQFKETMFPEAIGDLKVTGSIDKLWTPKVARHEFLQAVAYPWAHWKLTGRIVPFIYTIVEDKALWKEPVVRQIAITCTMEDFKWWEDLLEYAHKLHYSLFVDHVAGPHTCGDWGVGNGKCWYLPYCKQGKDWMGGFREIEFSELHNIEI